MRTLIRGRWVVGWSEEEQHHQLVRDGVCVVEGDRVSYVGRAYDGEVDARVDAPWALVSPGLISTHLHAGTNSGEAAFLDPGRPEALARNYLNWQAGVRGKPRYAEDVRIATTFGLAQCLRGGATTVLEIGCGGNPAVFVEQVERLGIRAYTGPSYRNVVMFARDDGRLEYDWSEDRGRQGLDRALRFAETYDGAANGRVRAVLCPGHADTCSPDLLEETARQARLNDLPVTIHAAINAVEMEHTLDAYRLTPIQLLDRHGLLGPRVILGHCVFLSGHSWERYHEAPDLALLGRSGATVSHSPLKYQHMGVYLESLRRYAAAGVNVTIGTDFAPGDMLREMRTAMLMSRVADRSFLSGAPRDVFDAATVNAARALGRTDLGRLCPGAKADVVLFDLRGLHFGAVRDPIRSLVENGSGTDVALVMVDGEVVLRDGRLTRVDQEDLTAGAQAEAERAWADVPRWMWGGRDMEAVAPLTYPESE